MNDSSSRHGQSGFTLVELVVVIVIIGILATIAVANYVNLSNASKAAACKANQMTLETAQRVYYAKHYIESGTGSYASDINDLLPYVSSISVPRCPDASGQLQLISDGRVTCTIVEHRRY